MNEPRFSVTDECPACKKTVKHMFDEHKKLIHIGESLIICVRCGCVFMPKSQIKYVLEGAEHRIIDPHSIKGQIISPDGGGI